MPEIYLVLEDGTMFKGKSFGYESETMGEVVFNTSMSGYQEILTDPSYTGQIVTMTYPMIGNYGVNEEDLESAKVQAAGFIVKEYSKTYSKYRATSSLGDYLIKNKVTGIEGIDTRKLTLHLRDRGALRGGLFHSPDKAVDKLLAFPSMNGLDLATGVSSREVYSFGEKKKSQPDVAVIDYGVKNNILRLLYSEGFNLTVYPSSAPLKTIIADGAKGIFLSNGPGDPDAVLGAKEFMKDIIREEIPCFGICLGHQIMGLGLGGKTYKLKFGHRGGNQPVKNLITGKVEITSQNHGFAVDPSSLAGSSDIEITHVNLNDNTVEGLRHKKLPVFSVQYHPEAAPGPHDSRYLFSQFRGMFK
jgi:carbamoyl-phosphate synthase small subunit